MYRRLQGAKGEKMSQELREMLKPPFTFNPYDKLRDSDGKDIMQFAYYSGYVSKFIVAALNEKAERELNEPLRWIIDNEYGYRGVRCPKCGTEYECFYEDIKEDYKYCPHCGQKLAEPENRGNK